MLAAQVQSVVVGWQLYALTHDPLTLGYVGLAQFLPMFLLVLPAGDLADRWPRQRLVAGSWLLLALTSALLLWLTLHPPQPLWAYFLVLALLGVSRAFAAPSMQALIPLVVPTDMLGKAIAWNASAFQIATIAGPALGGLIYLLGPAVAYALCFALFAGSSLAMVMLKPVREQLRGVRGPALQRLVAGISYIRQQPIILGAISLDLFAVLLGGSTALLPVFAHDILKVGPGGLGALRSSMAVGAFVTGLWLARWPLQRNTGRIMFLMVALFGFATLVFAWSQSFWLSFTALFVAGASDMVSVFIRAHLIQIATPDEMRGRVSAVNMLFIGASNELGEFESGLAARWLGAVGAAVVGGIGTLLVVGGWIRLFPVLWRTDRIQDVGPDR